MSACETLRRRYALKELGPKSRRPLVFVHGYGCDQTMWRWVAPAFAEQYRVITHDHLGSGASDVRAYNPGRYATLAAYGDDLAEICEGLDLRDAVVVGHSVGAMIALLGARVTSRVSALALVCPSPCYENLGDYRGGYDDGH